MAVPYQILQTEKTDWTSMSGIGGRADMLMDPECGKST